jgi:hypothetical protein
VLNRENCRSRISQKNCDYEVFELELEGS